jgi:hypothetical protein
MTCHAQDLIVDCSGQDPNAFHRIQDALPNIPFTPWQVVMQVTGTCQENVYIGHMRNLTIAAPLGQTATIQGDGVSYAPLMVDASTGIYLYGLILTGGQGPGLNVSSGAEVRIDTCTFQGNPGAGMAVSDNSAVTVYSGTFTDNNNGIQIFGNATVDHASWAGGSVVMSGNGLAGLFLSSGATYATGGNTTIQNNGLTASLGPDGFGVDVRGSGRIQFGSYVGPNVISGNRLGGVSLAENAEISFWGGSNTISGNGEIGIWNRLGSQITFAGNVVISGHSAIGVDISSKSQAFFDAGAGPNIIRNNGSGSAAVRAGIRVDGNSQLVLTGPNRITRNGGPGVLGDINSSMDVSGGVITGNQGDGIRLLHASVLDLGPETNLSGNSGNAIACDNSSIVVTQTKINAHCLNTQFSDTSVHQLTQSAPIVIDFSGKEQEYMRLHSLIPRPRVTTK